MAASGLGIALIPCSYRECGPPSLVYREITDSTLELSVGLAWKKGRKWGGLESSEPGERHEASRGLLDAIKE